MRYILSVAIDETVQGAELKRLRNSIARFALDTNDPVTSASAASGISSMKGVTRVVQTGIHEVPLGVWRKGSRS